MAKLEQDVSDKRKLKSKLESIENSNPSHFEFEDKVINPARDVIRGLDSTTQDKFQRVNDFNDDIKRLRKGSDELDALLDRTPVKKVIDKYETMVEDLILMSANQDWIITFLDTVLDQGESIIQKTQDVSKKKIELEQEQSMIEEYKNSMKETLQQQQKLSEKRLEIMEENREKEMETMKNTVERILDSAIKSMKSSQNQNKNLNDFPTNSNKGTQRSESTPSKVAKSNEKKDDEQEEEEEGEELDEKQNKDEEEIKEIKEEIDEDMERYMSGEVKKKVPMRKIDNLTDEQRESIGAFDYIKKVLESEYQKVGDWRFMGFSLSNRNNIKKDMKKAQQEIKEEEENG